MTMMEPKTQTGKKFCHFTIKRDEMEPYLIFLDASGGQTLHPVALRIIFSVMAAS